MDPLTEVHPLIRKQTLTASRTWMQKSRLSIFTLSVGAIVTFMICVTLKNEGHNNGGFVTASATESNLISTLNPSSFKPPIQKDYEPDIYAKALEFLTKKRFQLNQQRVLHRRILEQYKQKLSLSKVVKISGENARYTFVGLDATNGNHNVDVGINDSSIPQKRSGQKPYETIDESPGTESINDTMLNELTDKIADLTFENDTVSSRSNGGRSIDGGSSIFSRFTQVLDFSRVVREIETSVMSSVSCTACRAGVGLLNHYVKSGRPNSEIAAAAKKLCVNLKMQTPRVCSGIIDLYVDEVVEVLKGVVLDSNEICALVVGESCGEPISPNWKWSVAFPPIPKPEFHGFPEPKPGAPQLKVLQISDTHWDPFYEPGSNADCNEPLCCRITSGPKPPRPHLGAGLWGDYRKCDTPRRTMESMFEHISQAHSDIDYILWTGDIPAHDIWNQTQSGNLKMIKETMELFTQYFPYTPIFPALGNHESSPVNSFAPPWVKNPKFSIDYLYTELQNDWSRWLPETTLSTIKEGAFYSTMVKPGFKLISINTNYCNNKNWWLLINSTDPVDELKWLIFELQSSELAQEKVHIIGHIPPGHPDCLSTWSKNYYAIISRFESTVTGQFFGHTHFDELEIFYPKEDPYRACSIAYIAPSVTPYSNLNPGYRIYYVDGDYKESTRSVIDHETWVTDLGEANRVRAQRLLWYKLYSAKEAYGMTSLNPLQWDDIVMSMYKDNDLFNQYYRFYNKNSPVAPVCDTECKNRLLCDARSGKSHSRQELCKPRPIHVRASRGGLAVPKPQSKINQIFSIISSAFSSLMGFIAYPFGYG